MYRALIICNSIFPADTAQLPELNGPRVDGLYMWQALTNPLTSLFDPLEIDYLPERAHGEVSQAVEGLLQNATYEDVVLLYYSGHGRRSPDRELYLCARDTRTDRLRSTAVSCEALNKMMAESSARTIVVILDCCYSGAFSKGDENIADELKGSGRYVIAATSAVETAPDAELSRQPSPFTAVLANELHNGDFGENNLDSLYKCLSRRLTSPRPQRSFDSSGDEIIARRPVAAVQPPEAIPLEAQETLFHEGSATSAAGTLWRPRLRARNDISYGDLASWVVYFVCGIAQLIFAIDIFVKAGVWVLYDGYGNRIDVRDFMMPIIYGGAICGMLTLLSAFGQCLSQRKYLRSATSRRMLSIALSKSKAVRYVAGAQRSISIAGGLLALTFLAVTDGFDNPIFTILIALLILPCVMTIISWSGGGDAAFLAGSLIFMSGFFLPGYLSNESYQSSLPIVAIITLFVGVCMVLLWLFRVPPNILALVSVVSFLPILIAVTARTTDGPFLSLTGTMVALLGALLGDGAVVNDELQLDRLRPFARLARLASSVIRVQSDQ